MAAERERQALAGIIGSARAQDKQLRWLTYEAKHWYEEGTQYLQWIWGYVSGYNIMQPMSRQIKVDQEGITQWVKHYCENDADVTLLYATGAFAACR